MIEAEGLGFRFEDGAFVLDGIDLKVEEGERVAVLGMSGCGKTTLLKLVGGLLSPTEGTLDLTCSVDDVGFAFQQPRLLRWRSALENIRLPSGIGSSHKQINKREALRLLDLMELRDAWEQAPAELSEGMRSRVALARTFSTDPSVLLLDEPFSKLDIVNKEKIYRNCQDIMSGRTVMLVTHDLDEAVLLGTRIIILAGNPASVCFDETTDLPEDIEFRAESPKVDRWRRRCGNAFRLAAEDS